VRGRSLLLALLALAAAAPGASAAVVALEPERRTARTATFDVRRLRPLQITGATLRDADRSRRRIRVGVLRAAASAGRRVRLRLRPGRFGRRVRLLVRIDARPPSAPGAPAAREVGGRVHLTWRPARDDRGVERYRVWRAAAGARLPAARLLDTRVLGLVDSPGAGTWRYAIAAVDRAGNVGRRAVADVSLAAAIAAPVGPPSASADASAPRIAAVGDLACPPGFTVTPTSCQHGAVASAIAAGGYDAMLALGDVQYHDATIAEFASFDAGFRSLRALIRPVPGNHEYQTTGAAGYYGYFGPAAGAPDRGYYSFDIGAWHLVALNSNCSVVACSAGSAQETWLRADLAASPSACTLAFLHHPRFASGPHGSHTSVAPLWQALQDARADLVLSGHDHLYERLAPLTAAGAVDAAAGIRSFVVGTGGFSLYQSSTAVPGSEVLDGTSFGFLELVLHPGLYTWTFHPVAGGRLRDAGTGACR
jgi:acid phosphatase type 7